MEDVRTIPLPLQNKEMPENHGTLMLQPCFQEASDPVNQCPSLTGYPITSQQEVACEELGPILTPGGKDVLLA